MTITRSLDSCALFVVVAIAVGAAGAAEPPSPDKAARPPIRAFDLATLEKLGREIYRHDQLAWVATDVLMAKVSQKQLAAEGAAGWVVDVSGETPLVRFVRAKGDTLEAAYDILFPREGKPHVVTPEDRTLTQTQLGTHYASRTALDELAARKLPWCGGNPNFVVLPDPDGSGFVVYILRPKPSRDAVPVGGHYRISVAEDGKTVEQVDQLFASCLTLPKSKDVPKGGEVVGVSMSHIVSDTPLETHVFLSLQEGLPFYVITPDSHMWSVEKGSIERQN